MLFLLVAGNLRAGGLVLSLSAPAENFAAEEEIFLTAKLRNNSDAELELGLPYLQPQEKKCLYIGGQFLLDVIANDSVLAGFTNHMPPEPKPGTVAAKIRPGEEITWRVFFPYDYYPLDLPCTFKVTLKYQGVVSNEAAFRVRPSEGIAEPGNLLVNGSFSRGRDFPFGWKIQPPQIAWSEKEGNLSFTLNKATAEVEGAWVYSLYYPVKSPNSFKLTGRARSTGQEMMLFAEGWGLVKDRKRRLERNECYLHPDGTGAWQEFEFPIVFTNPAVSWVRVKLYAYLKPGTVWFDDITLRPEEK